MHRNRLRFESATPVNPSIAGCYIYGSMQPMSANSLLLQQANLLSSDILSAYKLNRKKLWLIRESRKEGMLTVHSIQWSVAMNAWNLLVPQRIAFTAGGWVDANKTTVELNELQPDLLRVRAGDAEACSIQLNQFLSAQFELQSDDRINPSPSQRSSLDIYSSYTCRHNSSTVALDSVIKSAITCSLSLKAFKDPVVSVHNHNHLVKGQSYERIKLEEMKLEENQDFYPNHKLKVIINYLGAQHDNLVKLAKINDTEMNDPIDLQTICDAVITPSGHSYSRTTITQHIQSREDPSDPIVPSISINETSIVPNINLDIFISGWASYYERKSEELSTNEPPLQRRRLL